MPAQQVPAGEPLGIRHNSSKPMSRRPLSVGLFVTWLAFGSASFLDADEFSRDHFRTGQEALRARRIPEAVDQFRIACFGLLEEVDALSACLVYLTLAQDAAKRPADVEATLARFLEVERRFAPYAKAALPADSRREFQAILLARVPEGTLLAVPSLAPLVETEDQKIARLPVDERIKALEAAENREPAAPKWPVALIQARTAAQQWRKALGGMAKLPAEAWTNYPQLFADLFVCQVETKEWIGAEASKPRIPPALLGRADVERAARSLEAERGRRTPP
jgi:hypothetical protein